MSSDLELHKGSRVESYRQLLLELVGQGFASFTHGDYFRNQTIGKRALFLRHDADRHIDSALAMARIEHELGLRATYFLLPPGDYHEDENYYGKITAGKVVLHDRMREVAQEIASLGHEIGLHNDFLQLSVRTGRDLREILAEQIESFRAIGIEIQGTASHGSTFAVASGFVNYQIFRECRPAAETQRSIELPDGRSFDLFSVSYRDLGLLYEAYSIPRDLYISDSGGSFSLNGEVLQRVEADHLRQALAKARTTIALLHPDWWTPRRRKEGQWRHAASTLAKAAEGLLPWARERKALREKLVTLKRENERLRRAVDAVGNDMRILHARIARHGPLPQTGNEEPGSGQRPAVYGVSGAAANPELASNDLCADCRQDGMAVLSLDLRDGEPGWTTAGTPALPALVEGRMALFAYGANTIECRPACIENERIFEKSLAAYVLFEGEPLSKALGYNPACITLDEYVSYDDFEARVRPLSKGNKLREARKAAALGYYCKPFSWRQHVPDVAEINHSKEQRSGGPMRADYLKSIDELGGAPQAAIPLTWPSCSYHWGIVFGVFLHVEGYCQGAVCTNEQLVGYISLRRYGNVVLYSQILGHGDHLSKNIMPLLHFETVRWLLQADNTFAKGLRYLMYGGWESGGEELRQWKRRVGFLPYFAIASSRPSAAASLLDAEGIRMPAAAGPDLARPEPAADVEDDQPSDAAATTSAAPDERDAKLARLDGVRRQANRSLFPTELLQGIDSVLSLFSGAFAGRNDLIHVVDAGVQSICCNDVQADCLDELRRLYGDLISEYALGDAFALVKEYRAAGRSFSAMIADPFTGLMPRLWMEIGDFLAVAERYAIVGICGDCLSALGTSEKTLDSWLQAKGLGEWRVLRLQERNAALAGGVHWAVLQRK